MPSSRDLWTERARIRIVPDGLEGVAMGQSEPFTRALIPFPDLFEGLTWFANAKVFLGELGFGTRRKKDLD